MKVSVVVEKGESEALRGLTAPPPRAREQEEEGRQAQGRRTSRWNPLRQLCERKKTEPPGLVVLVGPLLELMKGH